MANDYSTWPALSEITEHLAAAGITLRAGSTTDHQQGTLDAVIRQVREQTRREFVAAAGTRTFDGSGTPTLEVEEYVTLTSVALLGESGSVALTFNNPISMADNLFPKSLIHLFRGGVPWGQQPLLHHFPEGRENIQVVASWGYSATVPEDLWDAVVGETSARLAAEALFAPGYNSAAGIHMGRLKSVTAATVMQSWELVKMEDGMWWTQQYRLALRQYRRPAVRRLRRLYAPMV